MKPEERENERYALEDYCPVSAEEEMMFALLAQYTKKRKLDPQTMRVLDVGCGSGRVSKFIQEKGYKVVGLDFSEEAVKKAVAQSILAKRANLDEGIPEESGTFDVVWAGDIVEHVFDPIGLLRESFRVLKKNGVMLITIPVMSDWFPVSKCSLVFLTKNKCTIILAFINITLFLPPSY
jgi:2-polyprenyl-3-methyl-5-hydroxy-6-metoxy-1,4-benzoquinol methylase